MSLMAELGEGPVSSGGNSAGNKDNSNQQFGGDQFSGPRAPWMGQRGPGYGGPMGYNGPPGNYNPYVFKQQKIEKIIGIYYITLEERYIV